MGRIDDAPFQLICSAEPQRVYEIFSMLSGVVSPFSFTGKHGYVHNESFLIMQLTKWTISSSQNMSDTDNQLLCDMCVNE